MNSGYAADRQSRNRLERVMVRVRQDDLLVVQRYADEFGMSREVLLSLLLRVGLDVLKGDDSGEGLQRIRYLRGALTGEVVGPVSAVPALGSLSERIYVCPGCQCELERDVDGDWVCSDCQYVQRSASK